MRIALAAPLLAPLVVLGACSDSGEPDPVSRGRNVYRASCTACHNWDPSVAGSVGPAVAGSSRALLEARVLRAEYPPGYTPKKDSNLMPKMPWLEGDLDALTAYLDAAASSSSSE